MHILITLITLIGSVLFVLDRLGVDIGWLNPWAWKRRRRWIKQLHTNPAFNLDSPMEAAALLLLATARVNGDLSSEEKNTLIDIFKETFKQSDGDASALMVSSTYLFASGEEVLNRPHEVLARSLGKFTDEQKRSTLDLLERIANVGGPASPSQEKYIETVRVALFPDAAGEDWQ